jgi:tetraacyldisaccharide 4'-kinase
MKYLFLRLLLFPIGFIYVFIIYLRNFLFDRRILKSIEFDVPVISVGNLRVGGTGKTPLTEYIATLISGKYKACLLSRGYGRITDGFRMVSEGDSFLTVGDEPVQLFRKFGNSLSVAVGEDRLLAIPEILSEMNERAVIILDDAFQHRSVKPSMNIILTTWKNPFYKDYIMPYGFLRETRNSALRADCIVVSKCPPGISIAEMEDIKNSVKQYAPGKDIFFGYIEYDNPVHFSGPGTNPGNHVVLVTGIADPGPLISHVSEKFNVSKHLKFGDHHIFNERDCLLLKSEFEAIESEDKGVLMTEKDMVRFSTGKFNELLNHVSMFYIPIRFKFIGDGKIFDDKVYRVIEKFQMTN